MTLVKNVFLFVGGWQTRRLRPSGAKLILAGLCIDIACFVLFVAVNTWIMLLAILHEGDQFVDANLTAQVVGYFDTLVSLFMLVFEIVAAIWLYRYGNLLWSVPSRDFAQPQRTAQGGLEPSSAPTQGPVKAFFAWLSDVNNRRNRAGVVLGGILVAVLCALPGVGRNVQRTLNSENDRKKFQQLMKSLKQPNNPEALESKKEKAPEWNIPKELSVEEIVARFEKSVALIETPMGHGTGFVAGPKLVVTNAHVIELNTSPNLKVHFPSASDLAKRPYNVERVLHFDRKRDLALLEVSTSLAALDVASDYQLPRGQTVTVIGNPGVGRGAFKLENAVSKGIVSTESQLPTGRFLQLNISVNPGNSGGPVFAPSGEVIGVISLRPLDQEGIAFAIPSADVRGAITKAKALSDDQKDLLTSQTNARAIFIRTAKAATIYYTGALVIQVQWELAFKQFKKVQQSDFDQGRKLFEEKLRLNRQDHLLHMSEISEAITKAGTDPRLSETIRQRLADLWKTSESLRSDYDAPLGTLDQYQARCDRNLIALEDLTSSLRVLLGVDEQDLHLKLPK
jgi:serine protease Do